MNPVHGMRSLTRKGSPWVIFSWLGILSAFLIMTYYMQIMGWIINYLIKIATGQLNNLPAEQYSAVFDNFLANPMELILYMLIALLIVGLISSLGLNEGLEKSCSIMMPALFIMLLFLAGRSLSLPNALEGVKWYLTVDFSKINGRVLLTALGQTFFSIGIASGGGFIYGSYLEKDSNIPSDALMIIGFDTLAALIAGLMIFPAIFSMGLEPDKGPSLLFITMSNMFSRMFMGQFFGTMFFLLIFFAALTSALGYLEGIIVTLSEVMHIERKRSIWISIAAIFIVGLPSVMAQGPWADIKVLGRNLFDFIDFLSGDVMMPFGAILLAAYTIWVWRFEGFKEDVNRGAGKLKVENYWKPIVLFLVPAALLWIFVSGLLPVFMPA